MGKAQYNENTASFHPLTDQSYPLGLDVDVKSMKKKSLQFISLVVICGVLLILISFIDLSSSPESTSFIDSFARYFGICALITAIVFVCLLIYNSGRAVSRIVLYPTGFYINNDQFYNDGNMKVTIKTFMPLAGLADNVYLTVRSSMGTKKYWFGVKGDTNAEAVRSLVRSALAQLTPPIQF
ncbi:MAG: hypothetical protein IK109_07300 [Clostridiales bacterium]|nr:hypothetical protein [Clostridiales bacterium]